MTTTEDQIENQLIEKLKSLKYEYRTDSRLPQQPRRRDRRANPKARSPQDPQERPDAAAFPIPGGRMKNGCFRNPTLP